MSARRILLAAAATALGCVPPPVHWADCQAGAVDLRSDPASCGACHVECPDGVPCVDGACAVPDGWSICSPWSRSGHVSAEGLRSCAAEGGPWPLEVVDGAPTGCYVADLRSDPANCGACARACPAEAPCRAGGCVCPEGQALCEYRPDPYAVDSYGARAAPDVPLSPFVCADLRTDGTNCGGCGNRCGPDAVCTNGACEYPAAVEP